MAGLFYDPKIHDWGTPLANSIIKGISLGKGIKEGKEQSEMRALERTKVGQEIDSGKIDLDMKQRNEAAGAEIAAAADAFDVKRKDLIARAPKDVAAPVEQPAGPTPLTSVVPPAQPTAQVPTATAQGTPAAGPVVPAKPVAVPGAELANEAATQAQQANIPAPAQQAPLAGVQTKAAQENYTKEQKAYYEEMANLKSEFNSSVVAAYRKNKLPEKAMAFQEKEMKDGIAIAGAYGADAGLLYMKSTSQAADWKNAKVIEKKDHFQVEKFGPNHDGILIFNKQDSTIRVEREPSPKDPKSETPKTDFQSYRAGKIEKGWGEDQIAEGWKKYQQDIKRSGVSGGGGAEGDGKLKVGELTAVQKIVAQKYIPLAKDNARAEGMDPEQIDKIGTGSYYTYLNPTQRGSHDRVVIDAEGIAKKKAPASAVNEALTNWHKGGGQAQPAQQGGPRANLAEKAKATAVAQTAAAKKPKEIDVGGKKYVKITEDSAGNRWGYKADGSKELIKKGGS